jgi:hypothetical protein
MTSPVTTAITKLAESRNETWHFGVEDPDHIVDQATFSSKVHWGAVNPGGSISWTGTAKCTWNDIKDLVAQAKIDVQNSQYRFQRAPEYPSMGDQLDALWKGGAAAEEMAAKIQAVKDKYPKP